MIFHMNAPKQFWVDVVLTASFLIKRMPSSILNGQSFFHTLYPDIPLFQIDLKTFGCTCFVQDVHPQITKLDHKSLKCIFLGYSTN